MSTSLQPTPDEHLTPAEVDQLAADEKIIEAGIDAFFKVGIALSRIRDQRTYRATHATFEDYVQQRWFMSKTRAYQLIESGFVADQMSTIVDVPQIENEGQARALAPIVKESGPEAAAKVLRDVEATDGKITAAGIKSKAKKPKPKPKGFHKNPLLEQIEAGADAEPITIIPAPESEPIKVKAHVEPAPEPEPIKVRVHLKSDHENDNGLPTLEAITAMSLRQVVDLDRALQDRAGSKLRSQAMIEALEATSDRLNPLWVVIDTVKELPRLSHEDLVEIADLADWRPTADEVTKAIDALTRLRGMVAGGTS